MRVFALLFACYFAVLGCLSCTETEVCAVPNATASLHATPGGCGTSHDLGDWCSPLCQCHCCPGFSLPAAPVLAFVVPPVASYTVAGFAAQPVPAVPVRAPVTPWQPPRA